MASWGWRRGKRMRVRHRWIQAWAMTTVASFLVACGSSTGDHRISLSAGASTSVPTTAHGRPSPAPPSTSTTTSTTTTTTTAATTAPPRPGPGAIRSADFRNVEYPADACGKLAVVPGPWNVQNGEARQATPVDTPPANVPVATVTDVQFSDLTGDGTEEAVIILICNPGGGNTSEERISVYTPMLDGRPKRIGLLDPQSSSALYPPLMDSMTTGGGTVRVVESAWNGSDAHCCPSLKWAVTWKWNGSEFQPSQPEAVTPPPVDLTKINTDGVDDLTIGMSRQAFEERTGWRFVANAGCGPWKLEGAPDGVEVELDGDGRVSAMLFSTSSASTLSGLHPGDAADRARQIYGDRLVDVPGDLAGLPGIYNDAHSRAVFFLIQDGRISEIGVMAPPIPADFC